MKKILLIGLMISVLFVGCQEVNDLIQLYPPPGVNDQLTLDSTYTSTTSVQQKRVLIEDFTGDQCDNCPNAQTESVNIENANPGRISVIGIHCTDLAKPFPGYPDYRTANGTELVGYLIGTPSSLPTGDIDRKVHSFSLPPSVQVPYALWPFYVDSELILTSKANIAFNPAKKSYDPGSRTLNVTFTSNFTQSSTDTFYVSAAIIESGFKNPQLTATDTNYNFVFEHVLRKLMLPYNGLQIASAPNVGATYDVKFQTVLDPSWNADSCKIVAFVHHRSQGNNVVEQVQETTVK